MDNVNYFEDLFESIPDYRKIVLLMFLIKDDKNLLKEVGFSKNNTNQLSLEFENILLEEYEQYLNYIKNEESIIERFLNKKMEQYLSNLFEDIRYERSIILLLSLKEPDISKQSKFTDDEINITKDLALDKNK